MLISEFSILNYRDKLKVINQTGKLQKILILNEYQFSLYKVNDFYVELKRKLHEFTFDTILAMNSEDLPLAYK